MQMFCPPALVYMGDNVKNLDGDSVKEENWI
jgi:hypothetical protein